MLDEIHKGLQSLEEAVTDLQNKLFDLPRLETELATLLKLAMEPDRHVHAVRLVGMPQTMDFNVVIPIEDLIAAKRGELTDAMITLQKAVQNADEAYERLSEFDWRPDPAPILRPLNVVGSTCSVTARDNANEVA